MHDRGDEIHHVNPTWNVPPSIVEQRISAGAAAGSDGARAHGTEGRAAIRDGIDPHLAAAGRPATRSAASASISPTNSWSISTTRRTNICSPTTSAPTATAACGCRIRSNYAEVLLSLGPSRRRLYRGADPKMFGDNESDIQFPTSIPVNLTYQTAFVDDAGKLEFREDVYGRDKRADRDPQGRRPQGRRHPGRAQRRLRREVLACPTSPRCSAAAASSAATRAMRPAAMPAATTSSPACSGASAPRRPRRSRSRCTAAGPQPQSHPLRRQRRALTAATGPQGQVNRFFPAFPPNAPGGAGQKRPAGPYFAHTWGDSPVGRGWGDVKSALTLPFNNALALIGAAGGLSHVCANASVRDGSVHVCSARLIPRLPSVRMAGSCGLALLLLWPAPRACRTRALKARRAPSRCIISHR